MTWLASFLNKYPKPVSFLDICYPLASSSVKKSLAFSAKLRNY